MLVAVIGSAAAWDNSSKSRRRTAGAAAYAAGPGDVQRATRQSNWCARCSLCGASGRAAAVNAGAAANTWRPASAWPLRAWRLICEFNLQELRVKDLILHSQCSAVQSVLAGVEQLEQLVWRAANILACKMVQAAEAGRGQLRAAGVARAASCKAASWCSLCYVQ